MEESERMINPNQILKLLELHSLIVAYLLILDYKTDGDYDLVLEDEEYIQDVKKGFKKFIEKFSQILEENK